MISGEEKSQYTMHCQDNSLFTPFFNKHIIYPIAAKIPNSVTPNSITFFGVFIFCIGIFFMYLGMHVHQYFLMLSSVFIFCFGISDGLDGIQARNTNQCSILGEFLDHFFDLITYNIVFAGAFILFNITGYLFLFGMISYTLNFYNLHSQRYQSGQMIIGPISTYESLSLIALFILIESFFRGNFWLETWIKGAPDQIFNISSFIVIAIGFVIFKDTIKAFQTMREWIDFMLICVNSIIIYMFTGHMQYHTIYMSGLIIGMGGIFSSDYILMQHFKIKLYNRYILSVLFIVSGFLFMTVKSFQTSSYIFIAVLFIASIIILGRNFYRGFQFAE